MKPKSLVFAINGFIIVNILIIFNLFAEQKELKDPSPPEIKIIGKSGNKQACYWVVALDNKKHQTAISPPKKVTKIPVTLDQNNYVEISIEPIEGASSYAILKTSPMEPIINCSVKAGKTGKKTYYYWVQWCNNWRESALAGPFEVKCESAAGNAIEWETVPEATWYNVFRTNTPIPPVGRGFFAVGLHIASQEPRRGAVGIPGPKQIIDKGRLGQCVCKSEATKMTVSPWGKGYFLLAKTNGEKVFDKGQNLSFIYLKGMNETAREAIKGPRCNRSDFYSKRGAQFLIQAENKLPHLGNPSFGPGSHTETFVVENNFHSGGHSEYHWKPYGPKGWKGWSSAIVSRSTSWTANQHGSLTADLHCYGSGDAIPFCLDLYGYGPNNDSGDEGQYLIRAMNHRIMNSWQGVLKKTAEKGSTKLVLNKINFNQAGTERVIVNLTQHYTKGRISHVDNVVIHGKGTQWTSNLIGQWISFDVDTTKKGHRMWYWITDIAGPETMTIFAKTGWSDACNLGYSRFIWDPTVAKGPKNINTSSLALTTLPDWKKKHAQEGKYIICPGTQLGSPWKEGKTLNVEPLQQRWQRNDHVQIIPGPQAYMALGRIKLKGEVLPQDCVSGLVIGNHTNRISNGAGLQVGDNNQSNFREGIKIILGNQGDTDGLVISGENSWDKNGLPAGNSGVKRAAIIVPNNIAGISGETYWRYPHIRWSNDKNSQKAAMEITMKNGPTAARFDRNGNSEILQMNVLKNVCVGQDIVINGRMVGNSKTRGKATLKPDGKQRQFTIHFKQSQAPPIITFNTNQFTRSRLKSVDNKCFVIEFEEIPVTTNAPIIVWWHAQW